MKKILIFFTILAALAGFAWLGNKEKAENRPAQQALPAPNAALINTVWRSNPVELSLKDSPNILKLHFYADSVNFDLPFGSPLDVAWLLGGRGYGKKTHYSWDYSVEGNKIVLDPGLTGYSIPVEIAGDSLIWHGKTAPEAPFVSFKREF